MREPLRHASIDWSQGTPLARDFGDVYFSREGGDAETRHVFHLHNRLPERFAAVGEGHGFTIVETGFGTGLNWLATMALWRDSGAAGWLHYASVEKFPLAPADLTRAQAMWPDYAELSAALQARFPPLVPGFHRLVFPQWRSTLTLFLGDAADFLSHLSALADAWFLDGFAPARNPEMWEACLFNGMAALSKPGATFATFTAAGTVRRGLEAAGFAVTLARGHGQKRDMLCGHLPHAPAAARNQRAATPWLQRPGHGGGERHACVIGAGIAGAETAHRLALRGWKVTVLERHLPAQGGSGNPAAVLHPRLAPATMELDHFQQAAWLFAIQTLGEWRERAGWQACGLLQLLVGNAAESSPPSPAMVASGFVKPLSAAAASQKAGIEVAHDALWFPHAGWLAPETYIGALLTTPGIRLQRQAEVAQLERDEEGGWHLLDAAGRTLARAPVVIVANAFEARRLSPLEALPLQVIRGQVSLPQASASTCRLATLICHDGYLTPAQPDGRHCLGATFVPNCDDTQVTVEDHLANFEQLREVMPAFAASLPPPSDWQGRAALRCQSPDYLPLLGPVPDREAFLGAYAGLVDGKVADYPDLPALPGLFVNLAHGSRGFAQAALAAEILAAELDGEPYPVSRRVLDALHPARFWVRELRRRKQKGPANAGPVDTPGDR